MRKVEEIEHQIRGLSASEFAELREWLLEQDWSVWDKQIESDAAAGKLPAHVRDLADKNFALLKIDHRHPSLHFKRVGQFRSVRVGSHADYDKSVG